MKKQIFTLLLLLNSLLIFAQDDLPEYGKIDKSDMQLKECEFDKSADAYKLLSVGNVSYEMISGSFNVTNERRVRIKILNEDGLKKANVEIQFFSKQGYKAIENISGITYNLDNTGEIITSPLNRDSVKPVKISNKLTEITFTMPDAKIGSVIEYKYTYAEKSIANIDEWYFQDDIPTRLSRYTVTVPFMFKFETVAFAYQDIQQKSEIVNQNATFKRNSLAYASTQRVFMLTDVPALKKESFMPAQRDYLQRITFRLKQVEYGNGEKKDVNSDWPNVTKELLSDPDFGLQLKKKLPHTKKLDEQLSYVTGDYNKMKIIHEFVRKNIKWNGEESVYANKGAAFAMGKKSGNSAELNFVLISLLRDAGLHAYPILVSTHKNGRVNTKFPLLREFNMTMACVIVGDQKYILNAAEKYTPTDLIPSDVLNTNGFVVDTDNGGWIRLSSTKGIYKNEVFITASITREDSLSGVATINSYAYAKNSELKRIKEKNDTLEDYYVKPYHDLRISDIKFINLESDSSHLDQEFNFAMSVKSSGGDKNITLNLFQGFEKNPFTDDNRETDIDFDYKHYYLIEGKIAIPNYYQFKQIPKDLSITSPDSGIVMNRLIKVISDSLEFRITLDITKTFYGVGDYHLLRDFYKKFYTALNEQVVIRKKKKS
ncbi:MAG: DUF3857 domain-containing protein [Ginsengibacter sp.]